MFQAFAIASLLLSAAPVDQDAVPGSGARWLAEASLAYEDLRLDSCRIALDRALRDPSNDRGQLAEIYRLKGVVEASMEQPIAAKRAFANMVVLDPAAQLSDDHAPKIRKAFEAARASLPGEQGIALQSTAPDELLMGSPAELPIRLDDTLGLVEQIAVTYRVDGGELRPVLLTRIDRGVLRLPAEILPERDAPYFLELEAEAQNVYGATLARLQRGQPGTTVLVVAELTEPQQPWYQRWYVWASVAGGVAVLAAAAGTTAVLLAPADTSPRDVAVVLE